LNGGNAKIILDGCHGFYFSISMSLIGFYI